MKHRLSALFALAVAGASLIPFVRVGAARDVDNLDRGVVAMTTRAGDVSSVAWPAITREMRPWTRWWWMGSIVNEKDLTVEMEKYRTAGLGGLEITPIYGVKGYEEQFIEYLSPQWMAMLEHTLKEAGRLDLGIDMATGNGWPFGGPWVEADDACKNVVHRTFTLKAGESLAEPVVLVQKPMVRAIGRRVATSDLKEPIRANENLQALALEQVRFEKPLPLVDLMACSDQGQSLDLTDEVDAEGKLYWTAPAGEWTLYAVFQGWHGKIVERAGPGGEGNVIDHFSSQALGNYLRRFDRAFAGRDIAPLRAFFNDSYEVDDAAGESNWTPGFFGEFERRRGYDLRDHLPALFGDATAEKNCRILCDYRETVSDLLLEEFTVPWRKWAEGKGATTRNQAHGSPANLLDLYAASGIPETEGADIVKFKFASSAAHVTGKRLASSESATWLDEHFCATLADVKRAVDQFFLGGINHICYHGTTFSPPGEEWPGWLFYASVHFGPTNSFWNDFSALNAYVTRCQSLLQAGRPDNDVLVYFPIHDRWSEPGRSLLQHFDGRAAGTAARAVGQALLDAGYTFDFISDRQLCDVACRDGALRIGGASYRVILVPECRFIPLDTFVRLIDLARSGAAVVMHGSLPSDVPGWANLDRRQRAYRELASQLDFRETAGTKVRVAEVGRGKVYLGDDPNALLELACVERESMVDQGLRFVRRKDGRDRIYWIVNSHDETFDGWIRLGADAPAVALFDPVSGASGIAARREAGNGTVEVYLQLSSHQSCILKTLDAEAREPTYTYIRAQGRPRSIEGRWEIEFIAGGPELPAPVVTSDLVSWTQYDGEAVKKFSGTARYKTTFAAPQDRADAWLLDLGRVCDSARVTLNGKERGVLISPPFRILIPRERMKTENVLEVAVSNLMANRISDLDRRGVPWKKFYNVNFAARRAENRGHDGLFDASRWPPRESGLIGPVTVTPMEHIRRR